MTVAALTPSKSYTENGVTLAFAVPFRFLDGASLEVKRVNAGVVTTLAYGVDYTVSGGETDAGGTVTLFASVAGATLKIRRLTPRAQQTNYVPTDRFPADSHEAALDRSMLVDQEQDVKIEDTAARALMWPEGEAAGAMPSKANFVGKYWVGDVNGDPQPSGGTGADAGLRGDLAQASGAALLGWLLSQTYPAGSIGKALVDLFGQHQSSITVNPLLDGGLIGPVPDGNGSKTYRYHEFSLSGTRTSAVIGQCLVLKDAQAGPTSAAGISTANSASYVQSLVNIANNWNTSGLAGERDGQNIFIRQASSDAAGILCNVGVRSGFAVFAETYTFMADAAGTPTKAVNTQIGVINSRDGGEYGVIAHAAIGANLVAGFLALESGSATWADWFKAVRADGTVMANIRGSDGAFVGGSLVPRIDRGAQIGTGALAYANVYTSAVTYIDSGFAGLPAAASALGQLRFIANGSGAVGTAITAAGSTPMLVWSDGTNWMRIG